MTDKKSSESNKSTFRFDLNFKDQILRELEKATAERAEEVQLMSISEPTANEILSEELVEEIIDLDEIEHQTMSSETLLDDDIQAVVAKIEADFNPNTISEEEVFETREEDARGAIDFLKESPDDQLDYGETSDVQEEADDILEYDADDEDLEEEVSKIEIEEESKSDYKEDLDKSDDEETNHVMKKATTRINKEVKERNMKIKDISNRIVAILVSVIVLVALLLAFMGWRFVSSGLKPLDSTSEEYIQVEIPEGSGNKLIGQILEESGVIKSGVIFNYYTKFNNHANFLSGYYNLQSSMTLDEIIATLQEGGTSEPSRPVLGRILIPEGYTINQISKAVETNVNSDKDEESPFTANDFLKVVQDKDFIASMVEKYPNLLGYLPDANTATYQLEGYLFPATYDYYEESTIEELVEDMIAAMDRNLSAYYDDIEETGFDVNEILTLASLIEKEGSTDEDRKNIAGVFLNRLNQQIPLGSNISILYITGDLGSSETTLADDASIDTTIDSSYNTYQNLGLMPGPVDSPGLSAIKAAVSPNSHNDLYFVADVTTGDVYFAEDLETHEENVEKYVNSKLESSSSTDQSSSN